MHATEYITKLEVDGKLLENASNEYGHTHVCRYIQTTQKHVSSSIYRISGSKERQTTARKIRIIP